MRTSDLTAAVMLVLAAPAFGRQDQQQPIVPPAQTIQNPRSSNLPPLTRTSPPTAAELPKLSGTWTLVSGERNGQRLPDERIGGLKVTIGADMITVNDRDNRPALVVSYKLNTAKTPNEIDMKIVQGPHPNEVAHGIVTLDSAEQMRFCYSTGNQGRPAEFRTVPGGTVATLFILKRAPSEVLYAGTWQALDGEANGKKLPPEQINQTKVVLTANTLVLTDNFAHSTFVASYKLFTTQMPNAIDMTVVEGASKGQPAFGIIAPEGADRVRLCFGIGKQRPAAFRTAEGGEPQFCYLLGRLPSPIGAKPGAIQVPTPQPPPPSGTPPGGR